MTENTTHTTIAEHFANRINALAGEKYGYLGPDFDEIRDAVAADLAQWVETGANVAITEAGEAFGYGAEATTILRNAGLLDPEPEPEPVVEETPESDNQLDAILTEVRAIKAKVEGAVDDLVRRVNALERAAADNDIPLG